MPSILVAFRLSCAYEVDLIHLLETEFSKSGRASFQPLVRIPHVMTQHRGETEEKGSVQRKGIAWLSVREGFKNLLGFITPCLSRNIPGLGQTV